MDDWRIAGTGNDGFQAVTRVASQFLGSELELIGMMHIDTGRLGSRPSL